MTRTIPLVAFDFDHTLLGKTLEEPIISDKYNYNRKLHQDNKMHLEKKNRDIQKLIV